MVMGMTLLTSLHCMQVWVRYSSSAEAVEPGLDGSPGCGGSVTSMPLGSATRRWALSQDWEMHYRKQV